MPRFVLLYHDCPPGFVRSSHWDLMLESGDTLATWALAQLPHDWQAAHTQAMLTYPNCPPLADGNIVAAERLANHRMSYLDYEGPVSGGRGDVVRVAAGTFAILSLTDERWEISFDSGAIRDGLSLERSSPRRDAWLLTHRGIESQ